MLTATPVYDTYWRFAAERQEIFFRRIHCPKDSATADPILAQYKFTNAYRASDRVSQYLIRDVIYRGDQAPVEVFFRTLLFKLFNKIETWEMLVAAIGELRWATFRAGHYAAVLSRAMSLGSAIYSAAYIMPAAAGFEGVRKHETHLHWLEYVIRTGAAERVARAPTMKAAYEIMRGFPMMGAFLAYQLVIDLNYSEMVDWSEMEFVVAGPGARDGLGKCFVNLDKRNQEHAIRAVADAQEAEFERLGLSYRSLWGRRLQLVDCQNLFCEVDKYARVAHPTVAGHSRRVRIKQRFRPTPQPIDYWYPPKWGINKLLSSARAVDASGA